MDPYLLQRILMLGTAFIVLAAFSVGSLLRTSGTHAVARGIRVTGIGILSGVLIGLTAGALLRVCMSVIALMTQAALRGTLTDFLAPVGRFTWHGTSGFLQMASGVSGLLGLFYLLTLPVFPASKPARVAFAGVLAICTGGHAIIEPNSDYWRFGSAAFNVGSFAAICFAVGALFLVLVPRLERAVPRAEWPASSGGRAKVVLALLGLCLVVSFGIESMMMWIMGRPDVLLALIPPMVFAAVLRARRLELTPNRRAVALALVALPFLAGGVRISESVYLIHECKQDPTFAGCQHPGPYYTHGGYRPRQPANPNRAPTRQDPTQTAVVRTTE